jgi:AAA family ATP:ADP antiporter
MSGGGTIGGLVGSQIAKQLVSRVGVGNLLLFPAIMLVLGFIVYLRLERATQKSSGASLTPRNSGNATGGNPFSGFTAVFQSRYLLAICCFGVLLATCGTTVYFQQSEIVQSTFETAEAKTEYFADVNFWVLIVTLICQFFIVGWLMRNVGLGGTLAVLPLAYIAGISALAISPSIVVLAIISVTGRAAEYGICNPAREVLFTAVEREERYKAKSFIDTVVRRGGDSVVGGIYGWMRGPKLEVPMSTMSWIVVPIAMGWTLLALFIGRENTRVVKANSED